MNMIKIMSQFNLSSFLMHLKSFFNILEPQIMKIDHMTFKKQIQNKVFHFFRNNYNLLASPKVMENSGFKEVFNNIIDRVI